MKKTLVFVAVALMCFQARAQVYVGGSIGLETEGTKLVNNNRSSFMGGGTSFYFSPEVGYLFNEGFAAGARLNLNPYNTISADNIRINCFKWSINPYVRYCFWQIKRFGVWGEADIDFGTSKGASNGFAEFRYGIRVLPVLTFSVNEHLILESNLNFAGIGWNGSSQKLSDNVTAVYNKFGFNIGDCSLISVGVKYLF